METRDELQYNIIQGGPRKHGFARRAQRQALCRGNRNAGSIFDRGRGQEIELPSTRAETEQALRLALIAMTEAQKRIQRQEDRINELENLSQTDELTGLANRRGFDEDFRRASPMPSARSMAVFC